MDNLNTKHLADDEIKTKIKELIRQEKANQIEANRWLYLRKQVEVEEEWDLWCKTDEHRKHVKRWLREWARDNYITYSNMIENGNIPPVYVQATDDPDLYEKYYDDLSMKFRYRTKEKSRKIKRNKKITWLVVSGVLVFTGVILYTIIKLS